MAVGWNGCIVKDSDMLAHLIRQVKANLIFNILEIGARPLGGDAEPFHILPDLFPDSRIAAFEVDPELCEQLNRDARPGLTYYPVAVGRTEETRPFYQTAHPMCSSLYKPNAKLLEQYQNLDMAQMKCVSAVDTVSMDRFVVDNDIGPVDFIKIDIQGAELDAFEGAESALKDTLAIVSEAEFVPVYEKQPLFGDVCAFLAERGIIFHKFLGLEGRALKPTIVNNEKSFPVQLLWTDAMFLRDLTPPNSLAGDQLLKLAVLAHMYKSRDVAVVCLRQYDAAHGTQITQAYLDQWAIERKPAPMPTIESGRPAD